MEKLDRLILRATIKGLAAEGHRSRRFIERSSGDARTAHWQLKRAIGAEARLFMLAYAFLRGVTYRSVEKNTDKFQNPIKRDRLLEILNSYAPYCPTREATYVPGRGHLKLFTLDEVKKWLDASENSESKVEPAQPEQLPASGLKRVVNTVSRLISSRPIEMGK